MVNAEDVLLEVDMMEWGVHLLVEDNAWFLMRLWLMVSVYVRKAITDTMVIA